MVYHLYDVDRNICSTALKARSWLAAEEGRLQGRRLLVALSGGLDSMVLADLLCSAAELLELGGLEFAHIDHGLRKSSADEAAQLEGWLEERGKRLWVARLDPSAGDWRGVGVEGWGRRERYRLLEQIRIESNSHWIVTDHHRDDQAETVWMRLERGCGMGGLMGIKKCDTSRHLLRPLLQKSRANLQLWAAERQLWWIEDGSNRQLHYRRNWVRHQKLPALERGQPGVGFRLSQIAANSFALFPQLQQWALKKYPNSNSGVGAAVNFELDPEDLAIDSGALLRLSWDLHTASKGWPTLHANRWERLISAAVGRRHRVEMISPTVRVVVDPTPSKVHLQLWDSSMESG